MCQRFSIELQINYIIDGRCIYTIPLSAPLLGHWGRGDMEVTMAWTGSRLFAVIVGCIVLPGLEAVAMLPANPTMNDVANAKVFEEPLFPVSEPSVEEVRALAKALDAYVAGGRLDRLEPIRTYLHAYPAGAWRLPVLVNLGLMYRHVGQISQALETFEEAWRFGKVQSHPRAVALSHRALGELLELSAGLGRRAHLESLIQEASGRRLEGLITEKLAGARESLTAMRTSAGSAYRCGPVALAYLAARTDPFAFADVRFERMTSTDQGTSLAQNAAWATEVGLKLQAAKRSRGATIPVPSVLHWKTGHFSAVMASANGMYLVQDPFLGDTWVSPETVDLESSGFGLLPSAPLAQGWQPVTPEEAKQVWGKGAWGPGRPDDTRPDSHHLGGTPSPATGVPGYAFHTNVVSLHLDVPVVDYQPLKGPKAEFRLSYNQREYGQPQVFDYCNVGAKWSFSYLACIKDDTTNPNFNVAVCHSAGGGLLFQAKGDGTFRPDGPTQARLKRVAQAAYQIEYPDGRVEYYELADRGWGLRRVVLTRIQDRHGDEVRLGWDAMLRLVKVTDADGRATDIRYESKADPLKVTSIVDPRGRATELAYNEAGQLIRVASAKGGVTTFTYGGNPANGMPADALSMMANAKEKVTFQMGETVDGPSHRRWIEAVSSLGKRQRLEGGAGFNYAIAPANPPRVPGIDPEYHPNTFSFREAFFWDGTGPDQSKPDYAKANHFLFGHQAGGFSSGLVLSELKPGQPRRWFMHAGQFWGGVYAGAMAPEHPLRTDGSLREGVELRGMKDTGGARLTPMFDGDQGLLTHEYQTSTGQPKHVRARTYDLQGRLVSNMGAEGQTVEYTYHPANGDLRQVKDAKGGVHQFQHDQRHRLMSWRMPSGKTWVFRHGDQGRLTQVGPEGQDWRLEYDREGRIVKAVRGNRTKSFTFDLENRLQDARPAQKQGALKAAAPEWATAAFGGLLQGANGPVLQQLLLAPEAIQ